MQKARRARKRRVVFPEATEEKVLRACQVIVDENIAEPVLVGNPDEVAATVAFLAAEGGPIFSGQILQINGGQSRCSR